MEFLRELVFYLHLVGFALLLGGAAAQWFSGVFRINPAMLWGAVTQVVTGLILASPLGLEEDEDLSPAKVGVKTVVALAILVMVYVPRDRETVNKGHFMAIVGLIIANAAVAVFWL